MRTGSYQIENNMTYSDQNSQLYSYATLNKHPLNSLKILGIQKKSDDTIIPWFRRAEKIVYVSRKLPILISYHVEQKTHSFHLIKANMEENLKDNSKLNFQNKLYVLNNFSENYGVINFSLLITEMFYEDIHKENQLSKCKIFQSQSYGEILLAMLIQDVTSYVKIYSINLGSG